MADPSQLQIAGSRTLDESRRFIRKREADLWKFSKLEVTGKRNIARFTPSDNVPPDFVLLLATTAKPEGKTKQWSGSMLVAGKLKDVVLYR